MKKTEGTLEIVISIKDGCDQVYQALLSKMMELYDSNSARIKLTRFDLQLCEDDSDDDE